MKRSLGHLGLIGLIAATVGCTDAGDEAADRTFAATTPQNTLPASTPSIAATTSVRQITFDGDASYNKTIDELVTSSDLIVVAALEGAIERFASNGSEVARAQVLNWSIQQDVAGVSEPNAALVTFGVDPESEDVKSAVSSGVGIRATGFEVGALPTGQYLLFLERVEFRQFDQVGPLFTPVGGVQGVHVIESNGSLRPITADEIAEGQGIDARHYRIDMPPSVGGFYEDLDSTISAIRNVENFLPQGDPADNLDLRLRVERAGPGLTDSAVSVSLESGASYDIIHVVICHADAVSLAGCDLTTAVPVELDGSGSGSTTLRHPGAPFGEHNSTCEQVRCVVKAGYPDETLFAEAPLP